MQVVVHLDRGVDPRQEADLERRAIGTTDRHVDFLLWYQFIRYHDVDDFVTPDAERFP